MAIRTVSLYSGQTSTTYGEIYFNTNTRLWYADESCTQQITSVPIPSRSQYTFTGYHVSTSTGTLYIDANGNIIVTPTWTTSGTTTLYTSWTILSQKFYIAEAGETVTDPWIIPEPEFFRAVAGGDLYRNDKLTDGPITSITPPYRNQYAFRGCWYEDSQTSVITYNYIDKDGNLLSDLRTRAATSSYNLSISPKWYKCYNASLNANGGTGGETNPIWYDRVQGRWCSDSYLQNVITNVAKPKKSGQIFKGYYTASSGGTQVIGSAGNIKASWTSVTSANTNVYAQWKSPVTITLNPDGGSGSVNTLYYGNGEFFDSNELDTPVTSIEVPTKANHRFLGFFNGSTKVINADGSIVSTFAPSSAVTLTAQWERVSYTIAIQANDGTGVAAIYANAAKTAVYADEQCTGEAITSVTPFIRAGYRFMGLFSANAVSGTQLVAASGAFTDAMATFVANITGNTTIYALWQRVFTITLDAAGGSGAVGEIYYDDAYGQFYDDAAMTTPVTSITIPRLECYAFGGFYTAANGGGTQRIDAAGNIVAGFVPVESHTLYAKWTRRSYKLAFNTDGGTTTQAAVYKSGSSSTWYANDDLTNAVTSVAIPTKSGYTFAGYTSGGSSVVSAAGVILASAATAGDVTATASWTANTYTLTFDPNGGTTPTASKTVTFGQPVGNVPTATRTNAVFRGWEVDGVTINASTVWSIANNARAAAQWELQFGDVVDYFNMASSSLKPIASNSGDNKQRVCVSHTGPWENGVGETSGVWRNPTVTYVVARNTTLNVVLGKAFAAAAGRSGYMIIGAEVRTQVGQFPTVTITATANEGADAINKFNFSVPIVARSKAQNLLGAISGGGKLNTMSVVASCDPVVLAENMMPCASDVVHGRITASADTIIYNHNTAPTATNGFTEIGTPKNCTDASYSTWHIEAEKEM